MNHEDVYAEEVQEETLERQSPSKRQARISEDAIDGESENSPLIGSPHAQRATHKRGYSYQRAINEPWTGAHRSGPQPWYKKPSVGLFRCRTLNMTDNSSGLLASSSIFSFLHSLRRHYCTKDVPHPRSDMSRSPLGKSHSRSQIPLLADQTGCWQSTM